MRFALRGLRRDRVFSLAAIAMLAIAIGLNVTVFTVMDAMVFRGFPLVKRGDRLIYLQERGPSGACCLSYRDFEDWRDEARAFEAVAFVGERTVTVRDGNGSVDTLAFTVSANTFGLLGVAPMVGRDFIAADEVPGAAPVVMLNQRFWVSRFGKRLDVVGSDVLVNGAPATIIGIMPERFDFPTKENLWMPVTVTPGLQERGLTSGAFTAVARLRDGASVEQARAEIETINRRLAADYPDTNRGLLPSVVTSSQFNGGDNAAIIWGCLWAGACFVLLIACANVATLTVVRTIGRARELSTRLALGAGPWRITRQPVIESLALTSLAAMLGWWIANWSINKWATATDSRYQVLDYAVNASTLTYLIAISALTALLFSLAPISRIIQLGAGGVLKSDARVATRGVGSRYLAAGMIAGQMALAIVLLSGAGVLLRSFSTIVGADTGVRRPESILVGSVQLPSDRYQTQDMRRAYLGRLLAQLTSIPGIERGALAGTIPVKWIPLRTFEIEGRPRLPIGEDSVAFLRTGSEYFRVLEISPISGRDFNEGDHASGLPVAIVNESFAAGYWPGEQPLGKRLRVRDRNTTGEWRTVVGVVPNILQGDPLRQQFKPVVYVPFQQDPALRFAYFLLRSRTPPESVAYTVRVEAQRVDPEVMVDNVGSMKASFAFDRDFMDADHSELGKYSAVAPVFAITALLLAAIGLVAVVAHSVSQRTKEIGVRIAIGADAPDVRQMVVRDGMTPVVIGTIAGLAGSLGVNRVLQSQLVGVSPYDPITMTAAPLILIAVAFIACHIPARRAMRVDPVVALRLGLIFITFALSVSTLTAQDAGARGDAQKEQPAKQDDDDKKQGPDADEEKQTSFEDEVTVIATTRTGRRVEDEPIRVEVVPQEEIDEKVFMTPGDVSMMLTETNGLRVQVTSPSLGAASVRVQGLRGRYTQVLADGLPLYGPPGTIGILQIPPMDLAQVEVIKGVASALYGGSALGGVINLISRQPQRDRPERELLLNQTSRGATDGVLWLSKRGEGNWGYTFLGGGHFQGRNDIDKDGWTDLPNYRRITARPRVMWEDGSGRTVFFTVGTMAEDRRGGSMPDATAPDGRPFPEHLTTRRFDGGIVARLPFGSTRILTLRSSGLGQWHHHTFGADSEHDFHHTWFGEAALTGQSGRHTWVVGAALQRDKYSARELPAFDYNHVVPGVFAQDDLPVTSWFALSGSARADFHNQYGSFFSPRISALLHSTNGWTARLSTGTGFVAPTPFIEETEAAGLSKLRPLGNLVPERGRSVSFDVGWKRGVLELNATLFASHIDDALFLRDDEIANARGPVRTQGSELIARYHVEDMDLIATHMFVWSSEPNPDTAGRREVALNPRHTAGVDWLWEIKEHVRLGVEFFYTGRQQLDQSPYRTVSEPYLMWGAVAEWRVARARLFINVENLSDIRQTSYDPLVRPSPGPLGMWTVDAWGPLEGRILNGGIRVGF